MKEIVENQIFNYMFVYIFLFCFIVFLVISMSIRQKTIKKISILFFSIFFILFSFEYWLSFNRNFLFDYKLMITKNKIRIPNKENKHIVTVQHLQNKKTKDIKAIYNDVSFFNENKNDWDILFDSEYILYGEEDDSFRYTLCDENSKEAYIFLGCSYTYGHGCRDNETLPYYFSKKFNFKKNVINLGLTGKSSNSAINILNNDVFAPLLVPGTEIKYFFYSVIEDQIYRNFSRIGCQDYYLYKYDKFSYVQNSLLIIRNIFMHSFIFQKVFYDKIEDYNYKYYENYMIKSLKEIDRLVKEKYKAKLVVLLWNNNFKEYSDNFLRQLKVSNLDYIFLPDRLNTQDDMYKSTYDAHPRYKANEEIAEILYNHILKI